MSSWFNVDSLKEYAENFNVKELTDSIQNATESIQKALPKIDQEMLEKLTLTTPELQAERTRIDEEFRRKENARDTLAGMMPWETHDRERDILVEECRDAILQLSLDRQTFFGPYPMPLSKVNLGSTEPTEETDKSEEEESVEEEQHPPGGPSKPSAEALEKLAKLEPLPVLLQDFDLDTHVGLIDRLLKEDPQLVKMQSAHSGTAQQLVPLAYCSIRVLEPLSHMCVCCL
jgi:hypothetical protein